MMGATRVVVNLPADRYGDDLVTREDPINRASPDELGSKRRTIGGRMIGWP
jgi:hypothetical protein